MMNLDAGTPFRSAVSVNVPSARASGVACADCSTLHSAQQQLAAMERGRDQLLAAVAHELRNPLMPLQSGLALLQQANQTPERLARLSAMMKRQFDHLLRLIDDLEDVSRIRYGKLTLRLAPLDLQAAILPAVEAMGAVAARRRIEIDATGGPFTVKGDLHRLTQVFSNLLSNACSFTTDNARIDVRLSQVDGHVVASVRDDGAGIATDVLESIFDMFAQAHSDVQRPHGGLGIGLALVKQLVELHGGHVSAHSDGPGTGAQFTVRLPALIN